MKHRVAKWSVSADQWFMNTATQHGADSAVVQCDELRPLTTLRRRPFQQAQAAALLGTFAGTWREFESTVRAAAAYCPGPPRS
ncbi:hypothetical protein GCM10022197_11640 [Microlunatus spumicola]|uniref:Uncharacterized protein n=1 Tax=Microlunatus spumicola TaxID=81499 RepID=A0ABP6WZV5_9ACTN